MNSKVAPQFREPAILFRFLAWLPSVPGYKVAWTTLFLKKNLSFRTLFLRNDFISFWKLCSLSILSLLHCLQMFWTVSLQEFQYDIMFKKNGRLRESRVFLDRCLIKQWILSFFFWIVALSTVPFGDVWRQEPLTWLLNFVR